MRRPARHPPAVTVGYESSQPSDRGSEALQTNCPITDNLVARPLHYCIALGLNCSKHRSNFVKRGIAPRFYSLGDSSNPQSRALAGGLTHNSPRSK